MSVNWDSCLELLRHELSSEQFNMWIRPLKSEFDGEAFVLYAKNHFILDWVRDKYFEMIISTLRQLYGDDAPPLKIEVDGRQRTAPMTSSVPSIQTQTKPSSALQSQPVESGGLVRKEPSLSQYSLTDPTNQSLASQRPKKQHKSNLKVEYTLDNFVEGKSNQLARAAAMQVAEKPGKSYNPLFLYGSTGLGKTHLVHAVGNEIIRKNPNARVVYMHSERFVQDMVKALQKNAIDEFKRFYRSVDALLIDDIQFFAKKERSQEEFFHTFNALLESNQQIILTSDRYPKEIDGVDDRLKSRFGWGLAVVIEPPELETRVAILLKKAALNQIRLPDEVAFFMAKRIRSNVRDLEGALNLVIANANYSGRAITIDFVRDALHDLLATQDRQVTIENIIKTVAEYYNVKVSDLLSKKRTRMIARPRQVAMSLSKELTSHSLPDIGNSFGGRDHTTVLHAVRKIEELKVKDKDIMEDYKNLNRTLTS